MSLKAMDWAWRQRPETTVQKFMLVLLADRHNGDTGRCDASVARLAKDLMVHPRSARRVLQQLQDQGFIEIESRFHRGQQRTNQYLLHLGRKSPGETEESGAGVTESPVTEETGGTESAPLGVTEDAPLGVTESAPEPEVEPEVEPELQLVAPEGSTEWDRFLQWWQAYPKDRRRDRRSAWAQWQKIGTDGRNAAFRDVVTMERATRDEKWARGFSPEPHRYLQKRLWEEEWQEASDATRERGDGGLGVRGKQTPAERAVALYQQRIGRGR